MDQKTFKTIYWWICCN